MASAGTTLYTVGGVKEIPDIRTYVSVDGGMADNPRYILYQAEYTFEILEIKNKKYKKEIDEKINNAFSWINV